MHSLTLFEIAAEYRDMAEKLADLDLDEQTVADTLDGESGALVAKGTSIAAVVRNLDEAERFLRNLSDARLLPTTSRTYTHLPTPTPPHLLGALE